MDAVLENRDFLSAVRKTVASLMKMPAEQLEADAHFESLGIDSIVGMELIVRLSKEFSVPITPAQFAQVGTIRELAGHIEASAGSAGGTGRAEAAARPVSPPVSALPKLERRPVAYPPERSRQLRKQQDDERDRGVRAYICQKYSIDSSAIRFGSISEIVDYLVSNHYQELRRYYGGSPESRASAAEPQRLVANAERVEESDPASGHDIAIVGISCRFPDAPSHSVFWANLMARKSSIREIPDSRWRWQECYSESIGPGKTISRWGALVDDIDCFDADFFKVSPEEAQGMDPQERLLCQEVYRAIQDAGINIETLAGSDTGVFVGYEYAEYEHHFRAHADRFPERMRYSSASPTYYLANRISYAFDLCGPSEAINVNCAASAVAINRAYYSLANRESSLAVAAGVSLNLFAGDYIAETQYGLLSPDGTCG
ncbi:MAG: hypothetical protein HC938_15080, partial [Nitrospira sp.]|nr:hypothetical protein [Nitrospira sp.]